ncbi:MAG TPA: twin-arginine translocase subunit TatC [Candidatus Omnitrophota bacterium]|nr:twin-arginine translocase subunit TatC [Candidatus Omnitrophota bacterium]
MKRNPDDLSFLDHYEELRRRIIKCLCAILIGACCFYAFLDPVLAFLIKPVGRLVFVAPGEAFVVRIMLSVFGGAFFALPVILYHIWRFVIAGLKREEIKYVRIFAPFSFFLFIAGGLVAYFIAVPIAIRFLLNFSTETIVPMITVKNYISFVGTMLLAFGLIFELPLAVMFLAKIGVITPIFLERNRRQAIVIILIVSAVLTPPDVITQLIMAGPLIILYEIGIWAARCACPKR